MRRSMAILVFIVLIFSLIGVVFFLVTYTQFLHYQKQTAPSITVANWNMQIFGDKKASNDTLLQEYASKIKNYDVLFVQEIRDVDSSSFYTLCTLLPDYQCTISERSGRSSSKEQYGVIYRNITILQIIDFTSNEQEVFERPPLFVTFYKEGYRFSVYTIHVKPANVSQELRALQSLIASQNISGNLMIIGDLNADCNYYIPQKDIFATWYWIIKDDQDTTVAKSSCAYDRIIMNNDFYEEYVATTIDSTITEKLSDHYIVAARIRTTDNPIDDSFTAYWNYVIAVVF